MEKIVNLMEYLETLNSKGDPLISRALRCSVCDRFKEVIEILKDREDADSLFLKALCLLNIDKKDDSLYLFRKVSESSDGNFLAPAFCDYITGTHNETVRMYGSKDFTEHFVESSKSPVFENSYIAATNTMMDFFKNRTELNIAEIGIGEGRQICKLVEWIEKHGGPRVINVLGIEPSKLMVERCLFALDSVKSKFRIDVNYNIHNICAQHIKIEEVTKNFKSKRVDVINAGVSIHHMPKEAKMTLLNKIYNLRPELFILSDGNSNHESNLHNLSIELVSNVHSLYTNLMKCMIQSNPDDENAVKHYKGFCYADARDIIMGKDNERIEYHTTAENWISYLEKSKFKIVAPKDEWLIGIPDKYCLCRPNYMTTLHFNRPLVFQITARL